MPNAGTLRTLRLSATSGTRDIASMIASSDGGAGSPRRIYKFLKSANTVNALTPSDYFFNYLDGNKVHNQRFNTFYQMYSPNPQ